MDNSTDPSTIRELMRRNIEELFVAGLLGWQVHAGAALRNADLIPEIYAPDVVDHNPVPGQRSGHDGLRDVLVAFHEAFPDQEMELHGTLADGDFGVDFWTFRATHLGSLDGSPPTGKRVEFSGIDVARVVDGRISEIWHVEDMAAMWRQIND